VDINSIDIMALISSSDEAVQEVSTEAHSQVGSSLSGRCELKNAIPNKVFLDWNKLHFRL